VYLDRFRTAKRYPLGSSFSETDVAVKDRKVQLLVATTFFVAHEFLNDSAITLSVWCEASGFTPAEIGRQKDTFLLAVQYRLIFDYETRNSWWRQALEKNHNKPRVRCRRKPQSIDLELGVSGGSASSSGRGTPVNQGSSCMPVSVSVGIGLRGLVMIERPFGNNFVSPYSMPNPLMFYPHEVK